MQVIDNMDMGDRSRLKSYGQHGLCMLDCDSIQSPYGPHNCSVKNFVDLFLKHRYIQDF